MQHDQTFLTLIDVRLRSITEKLLATSDTNLPSHINRVDFQRFKDTYGSDGFLCRLSKCQRRFVSNEMREIHEANHIPSYPCLKCDFSGRGFKSRQDLERHTRQYHMQPEDFDIPTRLETPRNSLQMPRLHIRGVGSSRPTRNIPARKPDRWNDKGRSTLQRILTKAFQAVLHSEVDTGTSNEETATTCLVVKTFIDFASEAHHPCYHDLVEDPISITKIRSKIEDGDYQSLKEFRDDVHLLCQNARTYHREDSTLFRIADDIEVLAPLGSLSTIDEANSLFSFRQHVSANLEQKHINTQLLPILTTKDR